VFTGGARRPTSSALHVPPVLFEFCRASFTTMILSVMRTQSFVQSLAVCSSETIIICSIHPVKLIMSNTPISIVQASGWRRVRGGRCTDCGKVQPVTIDERHDGYHRGWHIPMPISTEPLDQTNSLDDRADVHIPYRCTPQPPYPSTLPCRLYRYRLRQVIAQAWPRSKSRFSKRT